MDTAAEADEALLPSAPHGGLTVDELAGRIGRKRTWVYDRLSARQSRPRRAGRPRPMARPEHGGQP